MKVLGINASSRGSKSQTRKLVQTALNGACSKGATVELVDLCKRNKSLRKCWDKGFHTWRNPGWKYQGKEKLCKTEKKIQGQQEVFSRLGEAQQGRVVPWVWIL